MIRFTNENPVSLDIRDEFSKLLYEHYKETVPYKDYQLNIDWEAYEDMYDSGFIEFFIGRNEEERIVAYALYVVSPSPHYKDKIYANMDLIYVDPKHRGSGLAKQLLNYCEDYLREERDVDLTTIGMKASVPFKKLAEDLGYDEMEYIYTKKLGVTNG